MAVVNVWEGAPTEEGFRVVAKVSGASTRLAVSTSSSLDNPTYFGPVTPSTEGIASLTATGLDAATRYWWAVEDDGVLDETYPGQIPTHPPVGDPASFAVTVVGDAGLEPLTPGVDGSFRTDRISNHTIFDLIRERALAEGHLMVCHLGDLHYYNPGDPNIITADLTGYRRCIDDVLLQPRQHELFRNVPIAHIWDDHDYGRNDSDASNPGRQFAWQVYREREPHYPLASATEGCHHAFQIGRVLFLAWDFRSFKTPKSTVDDAAKTALGASQKAWMRNLLETTTAEALVVLQQTAWTHTPNAGSDSWSGYNTERTELGQMFIDTGWADRMIMVGADAHTCAIDSGASNLWGGFPSGLFASLDATPSGTNAGYDQFISNARNQYGIVSVEDDGTQIRLTMTGYQEWDTLGSWTVTIDTTPPPPPVPPLPTAPPAIAAPIIRESITWFGVDQRTGRIIAELPDLTGTPERQLSAYANAEITVPLAVSGPGYVSIEDAVACTDGRSAALVAVVNGLPTWMGLPINRTRGSGATMSVPTCTPEGYFAKRHVGDHVFAGDDRAYVAYQLALDAESKGGLWQGLAFEYDVEYTGDAVDIDYTATDRTTVYDAIRALCVEGLEFCVDYDWADASQTRIVKILRIKRRIGRVSGTPMAMFTTGDAGSVTAYNERESWQSGAYANYVTAIGPGQGEDQPSSLPAIDFTALDAGVPLVELVVEPGNNITDANLLQAHADANLLRAQGGTAVLDIEAQLYAYPRPGVDCSLGDQASYHLVGPGHPEHRPLVGARRLTGYQIDPEKSRWRPKLTADPELEVET